MGAGMEDDAHADEALETQPLDALSDDVLERRLRLLTAKYDDNRCAAHAMRTCVVKQRPCPQYLLTNTRTHSLTDLNAYSGTYR